MTIFTLMVNAVIGYCVSNIGSSAGAFVYETVKRTADYVWLKPEEGYLKDYPEDQEKETNLRTVLKRIGKSCGK